MMRLEGFLPAFRRKARRVPDRVFAVFEGRPITFSDLDRMSDALAAGLRRLGLARGDRVAVMLRNGPAALAVPFGLGKAGVLWVPVNVQQRGDSLRHVLEHSAPRAILAEADLVGAIRESGAGTGAALLAHGDPGAPDRLEPLFAEGPFDEAEPAAEDDFAVAYTSGTTGRPKGVIVSHGMLRLAGEGVALVSAARDGDVMLVWEPLYHIGGSQMIVLPLIRDVTLAMVDRFSAGRFWRQARDAGATHIHYLGGILQILLKQPPGALDRAHGVRIAWGGGCPKDVWRPFEERFGVEIRECYGMTEASSITTYNADRAVGTVGKPVPWFSVALAAPDGRPAAAGGRGEILVRTSLPGAVFRGYFRDPAATGKALRDGVLHTGDLGSFDARGNLVFHGRMTDNVRCRGENVSAWEVEHVAAMHPAVEDCAMIGVAAEIGEQDIKLFVAPKPGAVVDAAALSAWLGERLAPYQNPRYIAVVETFERTPSQRIVKRKLSPRTDDCWDRLAAADSGAVSAARR